MSENVKTNRFEQSSKESIIHINRLIYAMKNLKEFFPLVEEKYKNLTDLEIEHVDQFIYRFMVTQKNI